MKVQFESSAPTSGGLLDKVREAGGFVDTDGTVSLLLENSNGDEVMVRRHLGGRYFVSDRRLEDVIYQIARPVSPGEALTLTF